MELIFGPGRLFVGFLLVLTAGALDCSGTPVPIQVDSPLLYTFPEDSRLWLGSARNGVFVADTITGELEQLVEGRGAPSNRTTCGIHALGRIWLGTADGLYAAESGSWTWSRVDGSNLPSATINCLETQGSYLWVGTSKGIAEYDSTSGNWRTYSEADGFPDDWVLSMRVEGDALWIGTMRGGVARLDLPSGSLEAWGRAEGLTSSTVFCLDVSPEWVLAGTSAGFSLLDRSNGEWMQYGSEHLPSPVAYSVLWVPETQRALIGTGYGLSILDPETQSCESMTKIGEINLEKVHGLVRAGDLVWLVRATNLWFSHRTSGVIGYVPEEDRWIRPIHLDVLVDQSGYGPGHGKAFMVQSNEPLEGQGYFRLMSRDGVEVYGGELGPRLDRGDWDAYYWRADFTEFQSRGNFTMAVEIGGHSGESYVFEIDNDVLIDECGELIYEFLRYMRCGVTHEYRSSPCHLDDGVLPNGTHIDATGGWHCAGLWGGKYSEYHTYVLFNLLFANELREDYFNAIDRDGDGLGDILNEAMWGCDFLLKMQMENGSIMHEVEKVEDTDGIIGTYDDRALRGWMPTYNGLLAVAGLAGTSALVEPWYPEVADGYLRGALRSFRFYEGQIAGGIGNSINGAAAVLACAQLYRATGNRSYLESAEAYCNQTVSWRMSGYYGTFDACALGQYLEVNPGTSLRDEVTRYLVDIAEERLRADLSPSNPRYPFEIPTWRLYIMDPWGAEVLLAHRFTGNRSYLEYGLGIIDCHLGVNPYMMCMLEGTGTYNPGGYGSYFKSPSNPRAAVPGSIPQGIRFVQGRPYYDISTSPAGESGETWLINTNFLEAISLIPVDDGEYPLIVPELPLQPWNILALIGLLWGLRRILLNCPPRNIQ